MTRDLDTPQQAMENPPIKFLTFLSCPIHLDTWIICWP
jgi:hypothetical protein